MATAKRITLPTEKDGATAALELIRRWGADAVRDCDGTALPDDLLELGLDVYSTICLVRADEQWTRAHPEYWPMKYLSTNAVPAFGETLEIPLLERLQFPLLQPSPVLPSSCSFVRHLRHLGSGLTPQFPLHDLDLEGRHQR